MCLPGRLDERLPPPLISHQECQEKLAERPSEEGCLGDLQSPEARTKSGGIHCLLGLHGKNGQTHIETSNRRKMGRIVTSGVLRKGSCW